MLKKNIERNQKVRADEFKADAFWELERKNKQAASVILGNDHAAFRAHRFRKGVYFTSGKNL